jgi:hypothetical protein
VVLVVVVVGDWENQTVGAEPNTLCRLKTVHGLQTVNLQENTNGPVRAKRGLISECADQQVLPRYDFELR